MNALCSTLSGRESIIVPILEDPRRHVVFSVDVKLDETSHPFGEFHIFRGGMLANGDIELATWAAVQILGIGDLATVEIRESETETPPQSITVRSQKEIVNQSAQNGDLADPRPARAPLLPHPEPSPFAVVVIVNDEPPICAPLRLCPNENITLLLTVDCSENAPQRGLSLSRYIYRGEPFPEPERWIRYRKFRSGDRLTVQILTTAHATPPLTTV